MAKHYIVCYFAIATATQYEHFSPIVAEKPLPLPHCVNGPLIGVISPTISQTFADAQCKWSPANDFLQNYILSVRTGLNMRIPHGGEQKETDDEQGGGERTK